MATTTEDSALAQTQRRYDILDLEQTNAMLPARVLQRLVPDPADAVPGAAPMFGEMALPHIFTQAGRYGAQGRAYAWYDEAIRDSWENAERMRRDAGIMESLECRQRSTALLKWHIEPEEEGDADEEKLAKDMTRILNRTPMFLDYRRCLLEALWYGRYANVCAFEKQYVGRFQRTVVQRWEPRQGDKLVFRYEDGTLRYNPQQVGIRIGSGYDPDPISKLNYRHHRQRKIEATQYGLTYWLDQYERDTMAVHKHMIEDAPYHDSLRAGSIHGVGIRDRIYLTWYMMVECLQRAIEYLDRSALGVEIWSYPAHNANAEAATRTAAEERIGGGRSIVLVPVFTGQDQEQYGVQHIEPGVAGLDALMNVIREYFGWQIKRYILGQVLSSEAQATGLGSGVADAHMLTYADIVRYDARKLEETLTREFLRVLQLRNFPGSDGTWLRFVIDTDSPDAEQKMSAFKNAWDMGAELRGEDVLGMIGATKPEPGEPTLFNPQLKAMRENPQQGLPGMQPGEMDPSNFDTPQDRDNDGVAGEGTPQAMLQTPQGPGEPASGEGAEVDGGMFSARYKYQAGDNEPAIPTPKQAEAGNYKKGHYNLHGMRISIEVAKGVSRNPEKGWPGMGAAYGYIRGTEGRDGDHLDCFLGPMPDSELVVVIDQLTEGGRFDEHKVLFGFTDTKSAVDAYRASYQPGWKVGPITTMAMPQFKAWLADGYQRQRIAKQVSKYAAKHEPLPMDVVLEDPSRYMGRSWGDLETIHTALASHYAQSKGPQNDPEGTWVTMPADGPGGEGTPVLIGHDGRIKKGPPALVGKGKADFEKTEPDDEYGGTIDTAAAIDRLLEKGYSPSDIGGLKTALEQGDEQLDITGVQNAVEDDILGMQIFDELRAGEGAEGQPEGEPPQGVSQEGPPADVSQWSPEQRIADWQQSGVQGASFKHWFGDWENDPANASKVVEPETGEPAEEFAMSKVTGADGQPVQMFHGTSGGAFEAFEKRWGQQTGGGEQEQLLYGPGIYFTDNPDIAGDYAKIKESQWRTSNATPEQLQDLANRSAEILREEFQRWVDADMELDGQLYRAAAEDLDAMDTSDTSEDNLRRLQGLAKLAQDIENTDPTTGDPLPEDQWPRTVDPSLIGTETSAYTHAVYLNIRKPFDADNDTIPNEAVEFVAEELKKAARMWGEEGDFEEQQRVFRRATDILMEMDVAPMDYHWLSGYASKRQINDGLKAAGYDGITHIGGQRVLRPGADELQRHRVFIAFEPNQIKSVNNRGTFDEDDDRMKFSAPYGRALERSIPMADGTHQVTLELYQGNKGQDPGVWTDDPPHEGEQRKHKPLVTQTSSYQTDPTVEAQDVAQDQQATTKQTGVIDEKVPGPAYPLADPPLDYGRIVWEAYCRRTGQVDKYAGRQQMLWREEDHPRDDDGKFTEKEGAPRKQQRLFNGDEPKKKTEPKPPPTRKQAPPEAPPEPEREADPWDVLRENNRGKYQAYLDYMAANRPDQTPMSPQEWQDALDAAVGRHKQAKEERGKKQAERRREEPKATERDRPEAAPKAEEPKAPKMGDSEHDSEYLSKKAALAEVDPYNAVGFNPEILDESLWPQRTEEQKQAIIENMTMQLGRIREAIDRQHRMLAEAIATMQKNGASLAETLEHEVDRDEWIAMTPDERTNHLAEAYETADRFRAKREKEIEAARPGFDATRFSSSKAPRFTSKAQANEFLKGFTTTGNAEPYDLPTPKLQQLADGLDKVLGSTGVKLSGLTWQRKGRRAIASYHFYHGSGPGGIGIQKTAMRTFKPEKIADQHRWHQESQELKTAKLEKLLDEYEQKPGHEAARANLRQSLADRKNRESPRWTVPSNLPEQHIEAVAAHEAGHALGYQGVAKNTAGQKVALHDAFKSRLDEEYMGDSDAYVRDRYGLSEYAASNHHELWAETIAALAMGKAEWVPERIRKVAEQVLDDAIYTGEPVRSSSVRTL